MLKKNVLKAPSRFFEPIVHETVSNAAVTQIEALILSGVLKEGVKLPGERELANQFEISRPKVREALQILEARDLVRVSHGDGAYISQLGAAAMSPALVDLYCRHPSAIYDHLEYRREQERFAARLAATRRTETDKSVIYNLLDAMKAADEIEDYERGAELDSDFHSAIVNASHNRILIHMMTSLYELNRSGVFFSRKEVLNISEVASALYEQHRAIGLAVCEAKPDEAAKAAGSHVDFIVDSTREALVEHEREAVAKKRMKFI